MKNYVQFKRINNLKYQDGKMIEVEPYLQEILGSDGVFILDGRNDINTMINDCHDRIKRLKNIFTVNAFEIHRGDFRNSTIVYKEVI